MSFKGKVKWALPVGIVCVFTLLMSLLMFPVLNSNVANVPFAILSLDEGVETPAGEINAGQSLIDKVTGAVSAEEDDTGEPPILWTVFESQEEFDEAMESTDFYGGIVIPEDFSQLQLAASTAAASPAGGTASLAATQANMPASQEGEAVAIEKPSVTLVMDGAKNASLANSLQAQLTSTLTAAGVEVEKTTVHDYDLGNTSAASMLAQVSVAPVLAMSMIGSMILFLVTRAKKGASRKERAKTYGKQMACALLVSFLIACADLFIMGVIGGMQLPIGMLLPYLWLCSLCLMTLMIGLLNLSLPVGALGMFVVMGTMSCAYVAPEMLPAIWLDWVYPWSPAHFIAEGVRQVVFVGTSFINESSSALLIVAAIGLACGLLGVSLASGKAKEDGSGTPEAAVPAA